MPTFWKELAGGTVGGVIGITAVYPLDTVKSRLQTSGQAQYTGMMHVLTSMARKEGGPTLIRITARAEPFERSLSLKFVNKPLSLGDTTHSAPAFYHSMTVKVQNTLARFNVAFLSGIMSWYRGLLSPVVGYGFMFAVSFSSYGLAGRTLLRLREAGGEDSLTLPEMSLAGVFAGAMNSPLRQMFERVKIVMQVRVGEKHKAPYSWSGACMMDLVQREGVMMGLFRGMTTTVLRETVQSAVYYPTYAITKKYLIPEDPARRSNIPEPMLQMISGGMAGCAIWMPPFYTLDVLKTRMQVAAPGAYRGTWDCAAKTWRAEGMGMFFRGLGPSLLRAAPLHGLVFLGYETTLSILNGHPLWNTSAERF